MSSTVASTLNIYLDKGDAINTKIIAATCELEEMAQKFSKEVDGLDNH